MVQEFLEGGGNLYIEMGGMFFRVIWAVIRTANEMKQLFGVESNQFSAIQNPIDTLFGTEDTPLEGILFTESDQLITGALTNYSRHQELWYPLLKTIMEMFRMIMDGTSTYGQKTF